MSICRRSSLSHHQPASQPVFLWGGQPPDLRAWSSWWACLVPSEDWRRRTVTMLAYFSLKTDGEGQWPCLLVLSKTEGERQWPCIIVHCQNAQPAKQSSHTTTHELSARVSVSQSLNKDVQISKDPTKRPNSLYTFSMSFLISRASYIQLSMQQFLWILHMWMMMMMAGGSSIDTSPKIGGG
jgi:hypothetical protein